MLSLFLTFFGLNDGLFFGGEHVCMWVCYWVLCVFLFSGEDSAECEPVKHASQKASQNTQEQKKKTSQNREKYLKNLTKSHSTQPFLRCQKGATCTGWLSLADCRLATATSGCKWDIWFLFLLERFSWWFYYSFTILLWFYYGYGFYLVLLI